MIVKQIASKFAFAKIHCCTVKRNVLANQTVYMMPDSHMLWGLFGIREYGLHAT